VGGLFVDTTALVKGSKDALDVTFLGGWLSK